MTSAGNPLMSDLTLRMQDLAARLLDDLPRETVPPALLVTSARPAEGKTTTALMLARMLAHVSGEPVLLADANFHRPQLDSLCGASGPGLANCLRQPALTETLSLPVWQDRVSVLSAGQDPDPVLLTRGAAVAGFAQRLPAAFRCLVFDGAESRLGGGALGKHVNGVLLVVDAGVTRREVVAGAIGQMRLPQGRLLGVVLNKRKHYIPGSIYKGL